MTNKIFAKATKHGFNDYKEIKLKNAIWITAIIYIPIILPQMSPKMKINKDKYWIVKTNLFVISAIL